MTGTEEAARVVLADLLECVKAGDLPGRERKTRRPTTSSRRRGSGSIHALGPDRWLVGVEGPADPVTGDRRRYTKVVRGPRELAEVTLAQLKVTVDR